MPHGDAILEWENFPCQALMCALDLFFAAGDEGLPSHAGMKKAPEGALRRGAAAA
jgi:hypothetical protein